MPKAEQDFRFSLNTSYSGWSILEHYYFNSKCAHKQRLRNSSTYLPLHLNLLGQWHAWKTERPHFPAATTINKGAHPDAPPGCGAEGRNNTQYEHLASWLTMVTTGTLRDLLFTTLIKDDPFITSTAQSEISGQINHCWFRSNSFCQVYHRLWHSDRKWGEQERRKTIQKGLRRAQRQGLTRRGADGYWRKEIQGEVDT